MKIRHILRRLLPAHWTRSKRPPFPPPIPVPALRATRVRVDFFRGSSINPGRSRNPWFWSITLPSGGIFACSPSFDTLAERSLCIHAGIASDALNHRNPSNGL